MSAVSIADGTKYLPPDLGTLDQRMAAADRPGEHLWVMTAAWRVTDPRAARDGPVLLDIENILAFAGPGCFKCEEPFSNRLARSPCRGNVTDSP